jgi:hypothetical protein
MQSNLDACISIVSGTTGALARKELDALRDELARLRQENTTLRDLIQREPGFSVTPLDNPCQCDWCNDARAALVANETKEGGDG